MAKRTFNKFRLFLFDHPILVRLMISLFVFGIGVAHQFEGYSEMGIARSGAFVVALSLMFAAQDLDVPVIRVLSDKEKEDYIEALSNVRSQNEGSRSQNLGDACKVLFKKSVLNERLERARMPKIQADAIMALFGTLIWGFGDLIPEIIVLAKISF